MPRQYFSCIRCCLTPCWSGSRAGGARSGAPANRHHVKFKLRTLAPAGTSYVCHQCTMRLFIRWLPARHGLVVCVEVDWSRSCSEATLGNSERRSPDRSNMCARTALVMNLLVSSWVDLAVLQLAGCGAIQVGRWGGPRFSPQPDEQRQRNPATGGRCRMENYCITCEKWRPIATS